MPLLARCFDVKTKRSGFANRACKGAEWPAFDQY
jgi:hypothetical protein